MLTKASALLAKIVAQLTKREIISATNEAVSLSYVAIYKSMLQRGLYLPARHAYRLALEA